MSCVNEDPRIAICEICPTGVTWIKSCWGFLAATVIRHKVIRHKVIRRKVIDSRMISPPLRQWIRFSPRINDRGWPDSPYRN